MKRKIEILAPAGSREAMEAAIEAGCDAVYIGGSSFGARAYANNLSKQELLEAIDDAHLHGKSLYLTVNTLLKERELQRDLYRYIERFYEQGLDAAIVQDVGVLRFLHQHFPELPLHISTQMTLTSADALRMLEDCGVTRIVTSRELSLTELQELRSQTNLEIESFVHGALCYCYSGQCLFASMSGGRSGNRGRCTQPCRMDYQVQTADGKRIFTAPYVLSPKDICTLEQIPELVEAGIDSFKIEGRMKRPEYAALTAALYRKWTDRYLELGAAAYQKYQNQNSEEMAEDIQRLADLYNRGGFSGGYYHQRNGKSMMSMERPNHYGVEAVSVIAVHKNSMELKALVPLYAQDVLEIRRKGRAEYEFTLKHELKKGTVFSANFLPGSRIHPGMTGYRTKCAALQKEIQESFLKIRKKLPISGCFEAQEGKPITLRLRAEWEDSLTEICCQGPIAERAKKQPLSTERIEQALRKTGESLYEWTKLEVQLEGELFFPVSALNILRRDGIEQLEAAILKPYHRKLEKQSSLEEQSSLEKQNSLEKETSLEKKTRKKADKTTDETEGFGLQQETSDWKLAIGIEQLEQLSPVLESLVSDIDRIYLPFKLTGWNRLLPAIKQIQGLGIEACLRFPRVFRSETRQMLEQEEEAVRVVLEQADGVLLHTIEEAGWLSKFFKTRFFMESPSEGKLFLKENFFLKENSGFVSAEGLPDPKKGKTMVLGENLYTWNEEAREFWREHGITHFTPPVELTREELSDLNLTQDEMLVYGYQPLMLSAQCVRKNTLGCLAENRLFLKDKKERLFPVVPICSECYNIIYHHEPLNLTGSLKEIRELGVARIRFDFTIEEATQIRQLLAAWRHHRKLSGGTEGHFRLGVE